MAKNYGPLVSGYLDPTGRNWETVVFQAGKPVLDKELNLGEDVDLGGAQEAITRAIPSGWLADDFITTTDPTGAIFMGSPASNTIEIPQNLFAHVNGWIIQVANTEFTGSNRLDLGAGPPNPGDRRTDVIVLEVWRRLISPAPSTDGKSAGSLIWRYGNVKTDPANDLVLNFPDDILDCTLGSESTKRVQIQYRLRVIQGVDIFSFPYGLDQPIVSVANSVPPNAATPDGTPTLFGYANQSASGDAGLWRAGDGNPLNTLGTVDGYMYAIPLMAVFRRNLSAFNRRLNHNGGVLSPGPSDRPDGLFNDIFVARDLADLRLGVSPNGWQLTEILQKNFNFLLDNQLYTEWTDTSPFGGGYAGVTVFAADEIGLANVHGGDGITTGTTGVGEFIGEFDAVRRRYSDRSTYELVTVAIPAPGGAWLNGASITIDPTALAVYPYAAFNWASFAPASVVIQDVVSASWIGNAGGKKTADAIPFVTSITSLGAIPVVPVNMNFGTIAPLGLTNETLYVEILIAFPPGIGLSRTPTDTFGAGTFFINNPGQLPAIAPVSFNAFANQTIDAPHREVQLEYTTVALTITQAADTTIVGASTFTLQERADSIVSVLRNALPLIGGVTLDVSGRIVTFTNPGDFTSPGDVLTIQYVALRPMPQNGEQMTIYYAARAPQTSRSQVIGTSIQVDPKYVSPDLYVITTGSGSQDEGYPWPFGYVQTGGIYPNSTNTYTGESELSGRAAVSVTEFNATTGFLKLPTFVPMVASPESLVFDRANSDIDVEGRSFFKTVPVGYVPNAYAQDLSDPKRHKDVLPVLCELAVDSALGFRGQLVLVLLLRYAIFDETDGVFFNSDLTQNTTVASVFRIKGNLLDKRAT